MENRRVPCFGNENVILLQPEKKDWSEKPFLFVYKTGPVFFGNFTGFLRVFTGFAAPIKFPAGVGRWHWLSFQIIQIVK